MAFYGNKLILLGGKRKSKIGMDVWIFDKDRLVWEEMLIGNPESGPAQMEGFASLLDKETGTLAIFGGRDPQDPENIKEETYFLDLGKGIWEKVEIVGVRPDVFCFQAYAFETSSRLLYLFGGSKRSLITNDFFKVDFWHKTYRERRRKLEAMDPFLSGKMIQKDEEKKEEEKEKESTQELRKEDKEEGTETKKKKEKLLAQEIERERKRRLFSRERLLGCLNEGESVELRQKKDRELLGLLKASIVRHEDKTLQTKSRVVPRYEKAVREFKTLSEEELRPLTIQKGDFEWGALRNEVREEEKKEEAPSMLRDTSLLSELALDTFRKEADKFDVEYENIRKELKAREGELAWLKEQIELKKNQKTGSGNGPKSVFVKCISRRKGDDCFVSKIQDIQTKSLKDFKSKFLEGALTDTKLDPFFFKDGKKNSLSNDEDWNSFLSLTKDKDIITISVSSTQRRN